MKKIIIIVSFVFSMFVTSSVFAQEAVKKTEDLKAEMAALQVRLQAAESKDNRPLSKFAGVGEEMGMAFKGFVEAIDGGMASTTARVNEFAQTDVGRYAMIGIGWKIFAQDIFQMAGAISGKLIGFILLIFFFMVLKTAAQTMFVGKMIVTKKEGPFYNRIVTKERSTPIMQVFRDRPSEAQCNMMIFCFIITIAILVASGASALAMLV